MPLQIISTKDRERLNTFVEFISSDELKNHYRLSAEDRSLIVKQREARNQLGFALQLCTLRHMGFIPADLSNPPDEILHFVADQLDLPAKAIRDYKRPATQSQHLRQIMGYLNFRRSTPLDVMTLVDWLSERALEHDKPLLLFEMACAYLYKRKVLRPGITLLEQYISEARTTAHTLTHAKLKPLLTKEMSALLDSVLNLREGERYTVLAWLQKSPTDPNVTQIKEVMEKIRFLHAAGVGNWDVAAVNPNRFKWLAKLGAKISKQNLLNSSVARRSSILIAFLHGSLYSFTDDVLNMFDQRLWALYGRAKSEFENDRRKARQEINDHLSAFQFLGEVLLDERISGKEIRDITFERIDRRLLAAKLQQNKALIRPERDAYVDYFRTHYTSVRNIAKPLLAHLEFEVWNEDNGLMEALDFVREVHAGKRHRIPKSAATGFVPQEWLDYLWQDGEIDRHIYELAAVWVLREKLRSGDVYVQHSRRYAPFESYLIPKADWTTQRLVVHELTGTPLTAEVRLTERKAELNDLCDLVEAGLIAEQADLSIKEDRLRYKRDKAEGQDPRIVQLKVALSATQKTIDITDAILKVDQQTGFSEAFQYFSVSKRSPSDVLLNVYACILSQGCNLGFAYMADAARIDYHALRDCNDWFINDDTLGRATTILVNKHHELAFSQRWGGGMLSSSDGQRFPMRKQEDT